MGAGQRVDFDEAELPERRIADGRLLRDAPVVVVPHEHRIVAPALPFGEIL